MGPKSGKRPRRSLHLVVSPVMQCRGSRADKTVSGLVSDELMLEIIQTELDKLHGKVPLLSLPLRSFRLTPLTELDP